MDQPSFQGFRNCKSFYWIWQTSLLHAGPRPGDAAEPTQYGLPNLPADTTLQVLKRLARCGWLVEWDYLELKQKLRLGHFEIRSRRGFHRHATLCSAAYGFVVTERSRFPALARAGKLELDADGPVAGCQLRGSGKSSTAA